MGPSQAADQISLDGFKAQLELYDSYIPEKLQGLEEKRLKTIPAALERRRQDGDAFLEKEEVQDLVEWKLKHGTYRPKLASLVASNSASTIRSTTKAAFRIYADSHDEYGEAVSTLATLKGIGPATASLLLACADPAAVPFFSDELFRYVHWESEARGKGWDRKIRYAIKEYRALWTRVQALRERLAGEAKGDGLVRAVDLEKVAYVLGRAAKEVAERGSEKSEEAVRRLGKEGVKRGGDPEEEGEEEEIRPPPSKRRRRASSPPPSTSEPA
ncbi:hypothetical protein B0A49_08014 [Cryomyces minteri]|uniref:Uncharacterized protein n=1 Tax=Cryomyces minteri TaxID=331657 RepID=A0A4U0WJJ9_9PEZI|nr:hypothetical protein B0A49_08014 [Cryomyces minteri]